MEHLLGLGQTSRMNSYLHKNLQSDYDYGRGQMLYSLSSELILKGQECRSHYPFGEAVIWNDFPSAVTV